MTTDAVSPTASSPTAIGKGMLIVGVIVAVVGVIVMVVASHEKSRAADQDFADSLYHLNTPGVVSDATAHAITLGHAGLGVLILGLVLGICGLMVVALKSTPSAPAPTA